MKFPDLGAWWDRVLIAARKRSRLVDHAWLTQERFFEVHGGQLAAAISYYAFFAAFSMSLLALSIFGYLLNIPRVYATVEGWLATNLPVIDIGVLEDSRQSVTILATVALVIAGVAWVQSVRSAIRLVWGLEAQPGHPILRWIIDLFVLIGVSLLLLITIGATAGAEWVLAWLDLDQAEGGLGLVIRGGSVLVGLMANALLAAVLLQALPRLALVPRRVFAASMFVAVGLELLKTLGRIYILQVSDRPAYQAVTTAVGLLIFLYMFNVLLMLAAAWTATSQHGKVIDLYQRAPIADGESRYDDADDGPEPMPLPMPRRSSQISGELSSFIRSHRASVTATRSPFTCTRGR